MTGRGEGRLFRLGPFGLGLAAGLAAFVLGFLVYLYWPRSPATPPAAGDLEVLSTGADVTRHGGRKVMIVSEQGRITQSCNGACDDLRHSTMSQGETFGVQIRDAAGRPVVQDGGAFAPGGESRTKITVSGDEKLTIQVAPPSGEAEAP